MHQEKLTSEKSVEFKRISKQAAGICAAATLAIQLSSCSPYSAEDSVERNDRYTDYASQELPQLHGASFTAGDYLPDNSLLKLQVGEGELNPNATDIPLEYLQAFYSMQNEPIVQLANRQQAVENYSITTGEYDAGWYKSSNRSIEFILGTNDNHSNLYKTVLGFVATGVHEASHGLTYDWTSDNSEEVALGACASFRDEVMNEYINNNRSKISDALRQTANNFRTTLHGNHTALYQKTNTEEHERIASYIAGFTSAANTLDASNENLSNSADSCNYVDVISALFNENSDDAASYSHYSESNPLDFINNEQLHFTSSAYSCIKDGEALGDINPESRSLAGHPSSNFQELIASTITVFSINPEYALGCMNELEQKQPERAESLWNLLESSWASITKYHPEVRGIVGESLAGERLTERLELNLRG